MTGSARRTGPPRLLIWTETYWVGGSDRFVADLLQGLDGEVEILLAGNRLPDFDTWLAERVPWALPRATIPIANLVDSPLARLRRRVTAPAPVPLAAELSSRPAATPAAALSAALRVRANAVNYLRLRRFLRRASPDAVLVNNGGYPGAESCRVLPLAARAEGIGRVAHFVHNMAYPPIWPAGAEQRLDRAVDAATDVWITAAHRASDALARERAIARDRIVTVHYGIAPPSPTPTGVARAVVRAELGFDDGVFAVAVVAAFERRKGHEVLMHALAQLDPRVHVALVGRGPEEHVLRTLAADLGVADRVRFAGWRDDVDAVLAASDALALPSLGNECLPYAILEAMAHGLPVVGTDVAGIPEQIDDGTTGVVVPPGDDAALARALGELAADPDRARAQGDAGRRRQRAQFSRERMTAEIVRLLDQTGE